LTIPSFPRPPQNILVDNVSCLLVQCTCNT
jgi:hypothetical protein